MKIEHGTLVVVADGAKLLLFRNEGDEKYAVLETLFHEDQRNPSSSEHGTDSPGRTRSSIDGRRSSLDETDWHGQAEEEFARHATDVLERKALAHPKSKIVVIAPPRTLGEMRKHYGRATGEHLVAEIDKDLAKHTTDDVVATIAGHSQARMHWNI